MTSLVIATVCYQASLFLTPPATPGDVRGSDADWPGELAALVVRDLELKSWLVKKDVLGKWTLPKETGFLKIIGAPAKVKVETRANGASWSSSGMKFTPIIITMDDGVRKRTVDTDYGSPVRGKSWYPIYQVDWKTGKESLFPSRDNQVSLIAKYGDFRKKSADFLPVKKYQLAGVPAALAQDLTYRWEGKSLCILDSKAKRRYLFVPPPAGVLYGKMTVKPIKG